MEGRGSPHRGLLPFPMLTHDETHELCNRLQILIGLIELDPCHAPEAVKPDGCTLERCCQEIRKITDFLNARTAIK